MFSVLLFYLFLIFIIGFVNLSFYSNCFIAYQFIKDLTDFFFKFYFNKWYDHNQIKFSCDLSKPNISGFFFIIISID